MLATGRSGVSAIARAGVDILPALALTARTDTDSGVGTGVVFPADVSCVPVHASTDAAVAATIARVIF
jgi:hypothetical protein